MEQLLSESKLFVLRVVELFRSSCVDEDVVSHFRHGSSCFDNVMYASSSILSGIMILESCLSIQRVYNSYIPINASPGHTQKNKCLCLCLCMQIMRVSIYRALMHLHVCTLMHLHVCTLELSSVSGTHTHITLTLTPHFSLFVSVYSEYACIYGALCGGIERIR